MNTEFKVIEKKYFSNISVNASTLTTFVGEVISVKDGVALINGLPNIKVGEMVNFLKKSKNSFGMAGNVEADQWDKVGVIVLGDEKLRTLGRLVNVGMAHMVGMVQQMVQQGGGLLRCTTYSSYSRTVLTKTDLYKKSLIIKRGMLSGKCPFALRSLYHGLKVLANNTNAVDQNNHQPLIDDLVDYSLDDSKGISQHKNAVLTSIIRKKVPAGAVYQSFKRQLPNHLTLPNITEMPEMPQIIVPNPEMLIDMRFSKEISSIRDFIQKFYPSGQIVSIQFNSDAIKDNFKGQIQTNHDFLVTLKSNKSNNILWRSMGLGHRGESTCVEEILIVRQHDEKGGKSMLLHTTKGHIGTLYYDENYNNIQMSNELFPIPVFPPFYHRQYERFHSVCEVDGITGNLKESLREFNNLLNTKKPEVLSINDILSLHEEAQQFVWTHFHTSQDFKRSATFLFPKVLASEPLDTKEQAFKARFCSCIGDRLLKMDKLGDRQLILKAMISAFKNTVDPLIMQRLQYLHYDANFELTSSFLQALASVIKHQL